MILNREQIQEIIPHRPPFLFVDEIVELEEGQRVVGTKTFTEEEVRGHFQGNPIVPGVLVVEALAQTGAVGILARPENKGRTPLFIGIDKFRFRKMVFPGDCVRLSIVLTNVRGSIAKAQATAFVGEHIVVEGTLTVALASPHNVTEYPHLPIVS